MTKVKESMQRPVLAVSASASIGTALKLMENAHVSILPVLSGTRLVGVITKKDADAEPPSARLSSIKLKLIYVTEDEPVESAARIMVKNAITRIPVISSESTMHCIGIISSTDIASYHNKM
ncbi:MAG: CBS domain-containing protein [Candidatus Micrarchaeaceae archaeon]